jgi:hypothetical protein
VPALTANILCWPKTEPTFPTGKVIRNLNQPVIEMSMAKTEIEFIN